MPSTVFSQPCLKVPFSDATTTADQYYSCTSRSCCLSGHPATKLWTCPVCLSQCVDMQTEHDTAFDRTVCRAACAHRASAGCADTRKFWSTSVGLPMAEGVQRKYVCAARKRHGSTCCHALTHTSLHVCAMQVCIQTHPALTCPSHVYAMHCS